MNPVGWVDPVVRLGAAVAVGAGAGALVADRALSVARRSPIVPIDVAVEVAAPLAAVWAAVSDIPRQPEWMREMQSVRIRTPGAVGEGTEAETTVRIFGIAVTDPVTVVEWTPPHAFAIRHEGIFRGLGRLTLREGVVPPPGASFGPTTIVEWREILVPPLLPHLGSVVQWPILRWIFQDDLYRLRTMIEAGAF